MFNITHQELERQAGEQRLARLAVRARFRGGKVRTPRAPRPDSDRVGRAGELSRGGGSAVRAAR